MDFVKVVALKDQILNGVALKKGDSHSIPKVLYERLAMNGQQLVAIVVEPIKEEVNVSSSEKEYKESFRIGRVESQDFSNE